MGNEFLISQLEFEEVERKKLLKYVPRRQLEENWVVVKDETDLERRLGASGNWWNRPWDR